MIQISGGKSALWWEQKRQMSGGKRNKLGGGKSDKGKWTTTLSYNIWLYYILLCKIILCFRVWNLSSAPPWLQVHNMCNLTIIVTNCDHLWLL